MEGEGWWDLVFALLIKKAALKGVCVWGVDINTQGL